MLLSHPLFVGGEVGHSFNIPYTHHTHHRHIQAAHADSALI